MQLNLTDEMANGGQYTFTFNSDGSFKPSGSDLVSRLQSLAMILSNVTVGYAGGWSGLFGSTTVVSFQFIGNDNSWTVHQVAQNMEGAMDEGLGNFTFARADGGRSTIADSGQGDGSGASPDQQGNALPSASSIAAGLGIGGVVVAIIAVALLVELKK